MPNRIKRFNLLSLIITVSFVLITAVIYGSHDSKEPVSKTNSENTILWQKPFKEKGMVIIPGSTQTDFGKFQFRWIVGNKGTARLATMEPSGSAEMPLIERKILPLILKNGNVFLFQENLPLLNVYKPVTLKKITEVPAVELFSVLSSKETPPVSPEIRDIQSIVWRKSYHKNGFQYTQGSVKAAFGTLNLYWKQKSGWNPELITIEAPGAGELPPVESKLITWTDEKKGITMVYHERFAQINEKYSSYLWCLTQVKTTDLYSGTNY